MPDDKAVRLCDAMEQALTERLAGIYAAALKKAITSLKRFFTEVRRVDEGKIQPPAYYDTPEKAAQWREGFTRELLRRYNVVETVHAYLREAGAEAAPEIQRRMEDMYRVNADYTAQQLNAEALETVSIPPGKQEVSILLRDRQPPFSKIAYQNLEQAPALTRQLQNEMAQAVLLGESQKKIVKRIQKVMGNGVYNATRIAQTERTRIQSQARNDMMAQAESDGVRMYKRWRARMKNTRDSHEALSGTEIPQDQAFHTLWGNALRYPGDPDAPAREVINCHCVLVPKVYLPGEGPEEQEGGSSDEEQKRNQVNQTAGNGETKMARASKVEANGRFVNRSEKLFRYANQIQPIDGYEDFTCHADEYNFYIDLGGHGKEEDFFQMTPKEYAERIRASQTYKGGNVRIISCQAGAKEDGAAQQLADALNVTVLAPTESVHVTEKGEMFVSNNDTLAEIWYNESDRSVIKPTGEWKVFKPRKE